MWHTPWIQAQKYGGIIGGWKKCILDNFDNQNQGKKFFWNPTLSFWGPSCHATINPAWRAGWPVLVKWQHERPMYDLKNSFSSAFVYIHRAKYVFSRNMFCLPHFWAKIHGVTCKHRWVRKSGAIEHKSLFRGVVVPSGVGLSGRVLRYFSLTKDFKGYKPFHCCLDGMHHAHVLN